MRRPARSTSASAPRRGMRRCSRPARSCSSSRTSSTPCSRASWARLRARCWDVTPVIVQDPVVGAVVPGRRRRRCFPSPTRQTGESRTFGCRRGEARERAGANEARLAAICSAASRRLGFDPVVLGTERPRRDRDVASAGGPSRRLGCAGGAREALGGRRRSARVPRPRAGAGRAGAGRFARSARSCRRPLFGDTFAYAVEVDRRRAKRTRCGWRVGHWAVHAVDRRAGSTRSERDGVVGSRSHSDSRASTAACLPRTASGTVRAAAARGAQRHRPRSARAAPAERDAFDRVSRTPRSRARRRRLSASSRAAPTPTTRVDAGLLRAGCSWPRRSSASPLRLAVGSPRSGRRTRPAGAPRRSGRARGPAAARVGPPADTGPASCRRASLARVVTQPGLAGDAATRRVVARAAGRSPPPRSSPSGSTDERGRASMSAPCAAIPLGDAAAFARSSDARPALMPWWLRASCGWRPRSSSWRCGSAADERRRCCPLVESGSSSSTCRPASPRTRTRGSPRRSTGSIRSDGAYGLVALLGHRVPGAPSRHAGARAAARSRGSSPCPRRRGPGALPDAAEEPVDGLVQRRHTDLDGAGARARRASASERLERPAVLLVSDLDDDTGDLERVSRVAVAYRRARDPAPRRRAQRGARGRGVHPHGSLPESGSFSRAALPGEGEQELAGRARPASLAAAAVLVALCCSLRCSSSPRLRWRTAA